MPQAMEAHSASYQSRFIVPIIRSASSRPAGSNPAFGVAAPITRSTSATPRWQAIHQTRVRVHAEPFALPVEIRPIAAPSALRIGEPDMPLLFTF